MTDKPSASERREYPIGKLTADELLALYKKSTDVVSWYAHPAEVRGPFCRWLTVSEVSPEYEKNVGTRADDAAYAAAAMNNVPYLLEQNAALTAEVAELKAVNEKLYAMRGEITKNDARTFGDLMIENAELRAEVDDLTLALDQKAGEIGRAEHRGNTVDYIYDKLETYSKQLCGLQPERDAWKQQCLEKDKEIERLKGLLDEK